MLQLIKQFILLLIWNYLLSAAFMCEFPFIEKEQYCAYLTEPEIYENNSCTVQVYMQYDKELYTNWPLLQHDYIIWFPIKQKYNYGPFVLDKPGQDYSNEFKLLTPLQNSDNCLVTSTLINYEYISANCFHKHRHVCAYLKAQHNILVPHTNIENCLCRLLNYESSEESDEKNECKLENDFSTEKVPISQEPITTGSSVCYSTKSSYCFCRVKTEEIPKPDLVLKFDAKKRELFLTVYSPEGILSTTDHVSESIYCFTDAAENEIKTQIHIDFIIATYSNTSRNRHIYQVELKEYIGNYWCEAFQVHNSTRITSNKVLAFERTASEFAIKIIYGNSEDECSNDIVNNRIFVVLKIIFSDIVKKLRLMEIIDISKHKCSSIFIIHASVHEENFIFNETELAEKYKEHDTDGIIDFVHIANALECEPYNDGLLNWPKTTIGENAIPHELCLNENGIPVRRFCGGNFTYGAEWIETNISCSENYNISLLTKKLHNITTSQNMEIGVARELVNISSQAVATATALDIEFVTEGIQKMFELRQNSSAYTFCVVDIIDNVMDYNTETLQDSQILFNAADNILHFSEVVFEDSDLIQNVSVLKIQKKNYLVHISKPFANSSNTFRLALYGNYSTFRILNFDNTFIHPEFTDDFIFALRITNDSFLNANSDNLTVIVTVYFQDKLFVDPKSVGSKTVVSIVVPEFGTDLQKPVTVWFRANDSNGNCSFWDYGDMFQKKNGSWSDIGGTFIRSFRNEFVVECEYLHLTPFAMLVEQKMGSNNINSTSSPHYHYLNVITLTGTVLSVAGIAVIFLSALLFRQWRAMVGTKILLQLAFIILLELILTQTAADVNITNNSIACTVVGIILHYTVCCKFGWMLVFAFLQYSRFVEVLVARTNHLVLKAALIGWLLPLLPVIIVVCVSLNNYSAGAFIFCYPKGLALTLGVLMPISLIIVINIFVFILIMYNIKTRNKQKHHKQLLAILLFFLLGFPWLFGIFIEIFRNTWFYDFCIYMFCITATLQGFILFVFYVVLNYNLRTKWKYFLCNNICINKNK